MTTRRKTLHLTVDLLEEFLKLQEGVKIRGIDMDHNKRALRITLESDSFDEIKDGVNPPAVKNYNEIVKVEKSRILLPH